jgi:hypothetical protein
VKAETILFRVRYESDDNKEREEFLDSRNFGWIAVCPQHHFACKRLLTNDRWTRTKRNYTGRN